MTSSMSRATRLAVVLALNLALIAGLVTVGITAHSLGVLAAGGDYLADALAIVVSLLAIRLGRRPPTLGRPNGHPRATAIAALINGLFLAFVVVVVFVEAARRLIDGAEPVDGLPVVVSSGIAAVAMLIGATVLGGDDDDNDDTDGDRANMRAVLLDTLADAAAAVGVALSGAVILATGRAYWLDPAVALLITVVIAYHVAVLLRDVTRSLRNGDARN